MVVVGCCVEFGDLVQTEHLPDKLEIGLTIALASANTLSISSDSNGSDDRKFSGFCDGLFPVNNMYMRFRWLECVLIILSLLLTNHSNRMASNRNSLSTPINSEHTYNYELNYTYYTWSTKW